MACAKIGTVRNRSAVSTTVDPKPDGPTHRAFQWYHSFALGPRFPRQGLVDRFCFSRLAGEFCISQPFADNLTDADVKSLRIGHLAIVKTKCLLVNVAKQVERLYADVGAMQAAFQSDQKFSIALV